MTFRRACAGALCATAALLAATAALARPTLAGSVPADNTEVEAPARVELRFSEDLATRSSGARLVMTGMPGMAGHPPMGMAVKVSAGENPRTMLITPEQPLPAGSYRVEWRAGSSGASPATGSLNFTVK